MRPRIASCGGPASQQSSCAVKRTRFFVEQITAVLQQVEGASRSLTILLLSLSSASHFELFTFHFSLSTLNFPLRDEKLRNPLRRALRIFVAARMDPGHHWCRAAGPVDGAAAPTGRALARNAVGAHRRFDCRLLIGERNLQIRSTRDLQYRFGLFELHRRTQR